MPEQANTVESPGQTFSHSDRSSESLDDSLLNGFPIPVRVQSLSAQARRPARDEDECITFGYRRLLSNTRIREPLISSQGHLSTELYKPLFIHDVLMQPGSLSALLGRLSSVEILTRMTPANLRGYTALVHPTTHLPCIVPSSDPAETVKGVVLFGAGRISRDKIHQHYTHYGVHDATYLPVEVDVDFSEEGETGAIVWHPGRKEIEAVVWTWGASAEPLLGSAYESERAKWTLENYLGGKFDEDTDCRLLIVDADQWADVEVHITDDEGKMSNGWDFLDENNVEDENVYEVPKDFAGW
ncbi:hypothetical protein K470DRAFT_255314 [Piedraia hortae CBS 480.64]|uniref:Uncharacterized protein n=1 Tax=Piedraia hortae CBS 480.64 TaxID=1314780 RepID=A0A6A7C6U3_9PEZI|nr:hypothetical protein K470DRAFT_255314 [Piedraia hortae CBS 480.64]